MKLKELLKVIAAEAKIMIYIPAPEPECWRKIFDGDASEAKLDEDVEKVLNTPVYCIDTEYSNGGYEAISIQL